MKFGKKAVFAGIAAITLSLSLAACGGGDPSSESTAPQQTNTDSSQVPADYNPQERDNVQDGGTLTQSIVEVSSQWNTFNADGSAYTAKLWSWYNPQMVFYTPEGEWSPNPDYLTDVTDEVVDGNTVVTYTMNPEAKWNDGDPITWESFKTTWEASSGKSDEYNASSTDGYSNVKSVEQGEDEYQAVVTFDGPWAWWQGMFNFILNPNVDSPEVYNEGYINTPHEEWGAGPYTIDSFDKKTGVVTFKKNPNWWGDPGKLDTVTFRQMESTAAVNAFKNGEIDTVDVGTKDRLAQVADMDAITVHRAGSVANELITLNADTPHLGDIKVRQAVMMGIDRKVLQQIEFNGLDYTEVPPGSFNLFPFQEGYKDAFTESGYKFSKEEANKLLDEAGWTQGEDGIRTKDGERLSLSFPVIGDEPVTIAKAKAIVSMLKEVGVEAKIEQKPSSEFSAVFSGNEWDMFRLGFTSSDPFGVAYMCQLYCSDSGLNLSHTGTEEFDAKIQELAKIADQQEQTAAAMELEPEVMAGTWGIMPIINGPTLLATKEGLANIDPEPYSGVDLFRTGPVQDVGWQK
jgi:peptide/nickel transport system substrate-binding protein